ncbi:hypothetical protein RHSIM_RhsimUnG0236200 [Rhododendron simsii]|uniref:CWF21 domain-containing protein n=1 Tax=Rhododendron simsii TaxID=118357 RepID=A0A834FVH1_RHOSS|nr:hypothetical protein RHSIM_RhsimUnG0236200 [Rhododendron simsii]
MHDRIGLKTPRGSGTNRYLQGNKFFVRPKSGGGGKVVVENNKCDVVFKKPNEEILKHDRKRQIELKLVVLEDKLIDLGYTEPEAEVSDKLAGSRRNLLEKLPARTNLSL